jgi:hypothetical protein
MAIDQHLIQKWCQMPLTKKVLETRDGIRTDGDLTQSSRNGFGFVFLLILRCKLDTANRLLENLFRVPKFSAATVRPDEQLALELFWSTFSSRPDNAP